MEETDLTAISTKANEGNWTRVNRNKENEKSIIDYILIDKQENEEVEEMVIDEQGWLRLKNTTGQGVIESDHNTMVIKLRNHRRAERQTKTVWKKAGKTEWHNFNEEMKKQNMKCRIETYEQLKQQIEAALNKTIGKIKIQTNKKRKHGPKTREAKKHRKEARKEFEKAIRNKLPNIEEKLQKYRESQITMRETSDKEEKERVEKIFKEIIKEGGTKSQTFWKARQRILKSNQVPQYNIITEEGDTIEDALQAKEYIATYFENLYQAREANEDNIAETERIKDLVLQWAEDPDHNCEQPDITTEELDTVIKKLKRNKSCGPDNIPNEVIIEANEDTKEIYRHVFNNILQNQSIPEDWQIGTITRLYKGKGQLGKCSNERGITCASNMGKAMERILDKRARKVTYISDAQAGGKEKRATTDHLLVLKETVKTQSRKKKATYITYLDVTKAYDKAWSDGIMYAMHENGLQGPLWNTIRRFNRGLKAKIKTKDGLTRPINIKDSIRQGGVLSVLQYATVMDEIAKEIETQDKGVKIHENKKIGCLLWMDDVVLIAENQKELQEMIDITKQVADKYHIVFGKEKSKVMVIKDKEHNTKITMGDMELGVTDRYKYLGEIINNKRNIKDHTIEIRRKAEGALQTILTIAGDPCLKKIEMEVIWKLVETCIIPIIVYSGETWDTNKTEMNNVNRILDNILKRLLMVPTTTPREALYEEINILDIEHTIMRNRINMHCRMERTKNEMLQEILNIQDQKAWVNITEKMEEDLNLQDIIYRPVREGKIMIKVQTAMKMKEVISKGAEKKTKVEYLIRNKNTSNSYERPAYIQKLNRFEVSIIFKARTRMLDTKNNFRGKYTDIKCRACGIEKETQEHVLERCPNIHKDENNRVTTQDIFSEDVEELKRTAKKIASTIDILHSAVHNGVHPGDLGNCTNN
jgi:hypothetical protein